MNLFDFIHDLDSKGIDATERESEIWEHYGRTRAIMVLDSTGSSRVSQSHGVVHFLSRLAKIRVQLKAIIDDFKPEGIKCEADNIFAIFSDLNTSLRVASAIHESMNQNLVMLTKDEPFRVCIGIGYGQVLYGGHDEGYFGDEMNLASLLGEDTAAAGETLITQSVFEAAEQSLLDGFEPRKLNLSGISATCYLKASR